MKKFFAIASALLIAVSAFAQETNKDENGNYKYGGYETNGFWDNWFVGAGVGVNGSMDNLDKVYLGVLGSNDATGEGVVFPGIDVFVGKWIEPCYGVRIGWHGLKNTAEITKQQNDNVTVNDVHADFLWNISNQFWGYKENRFYNLSPYFSAGYIWSRYCKCGGAGLGLLNQFRLGSKWGLYADVRGLMTRAGIVGDPGTNILLSATAGLTYGFGKTNFTRVSTTAAAAAAAIAAAEAAKNAAAEDAAKAKKNADDALADANNALAEAKQLKDEADKAAKDAANTQGLFDEPVVVFFEIGKATLTSTEKAHAEYTIKNIISRGNNVKFTLGGSADTKTGSAKRNKQLSEQRAQTIVNLIDELGISHDNIEIVEWDGKFQRFSVNELNRCVFIEKQ